MSRLSQALTTALTLIAACSLSAASVYAQAPPQVQGMASYATLRAGAPTAAGRWDYTFVFAACNECRRTFAQVEIVLPAGVTVSVLEEAEGWVMTTAHTGAVKFFRKVTTGGALTLKVRVEAPTAKMSEGSVTWEARDGQTPASESGSIVGPKVAAAPSKFTTVIGGGFGFLRDDYAEYTIENEILVITNDSRFRATALAGVNFEIGKRTGLLAGLKYAEGTTSLLEAFTAGFTVKISNEATLVFGFSRGKGRELSAGFEKAAAAYLTANPDALPGVRVRSDGQGFESQRDYDGLSTKALDYKGRIVTDSWNATFSIGVVFPVSLNFGGDKASKDGGGK